MIPMNKFAKIKWLMNMNTTANIWQPGYLVLICFRISVHPSAFLKIKTKIIYVKYVNQYRL